ncbi:MAG: hypothetical protein ACE5Q6_20680, partial [Dehalococcoidia bacterium]
MPESSTPRKSSTTATSTHPIGTATVRAPGVCGELVQGMQEDTYYLVTCPIDFYARVQVQILDGTSEIITPENCPKTEASVRATLAYLDRADAGVQVNISNPIPRSKGMGSSSADVSAAIAATGLALGRELTAAEIAQLALSVEPSDGVMFPGIT